jgi:hypothetical protein
MDVERGVGIPVMRVPTGHAHEITTALGHHRKADRDEIQEYHDGY